MTTFSRLSSSVMRDSGFAGAARAAQRHAGGLHGRQRLHVGRAWADRQAGDV